jgi:Skp family chaperone for outer membrane proteins
MEMFWTEMYRTEMLGAALVLLVACTGGLLAYLIGSSRQAARAPAYAYATTRRHLRRAPRRTDVAIVLDKEENGYEFRPIHPDYRG